MNYCELHLHDYYSALDGLNSPEEYMKRAKELGMTHLSQTNHGTLAGHRDFQRAASEAGITPILGLEAYISATDRFDKRSKAAREDGTSVYNHIILLAQDEVGLKTLSRLSEKAWTEGFYSKPRIDSELLFDDNEGLIVLSGCLNGLLCKAIERGDLAGARLTAKTYKEVLGDRFYIEVQGHNPVEMNVALLDIADQYGIPAVATSDCHYARQEDLWIEESMLILSTNPKKNFAADMSKASKMDLLERFNYLYPDRKMTFQEIEIFLRDRKSNAELFNAQGIDREDIYDNTMQIASRVGEYPFYSGLDLLPKPEGADPDDLLAEKAWAGLRALGKAGDEVYAERLRTELEVIKGKKFSAYFLIVADMVEYAKENGIPVGPGRGSAAGSLVCYSLGITGCDPIKYGLLFFRFIDPERDDFPDVDTDFGDRRRGEVKEYLRRKYKNVASIATFNRFQGKNSLKDASRVLGIPVAEVNRATKNNDAPPGAYYFDTFDSSEKGREFAEKYPEAVDLAKQLYGRIRGGGMHAAGVVIANQPISNFAPMETAKDPSDKAGPRLPMVANDMNEVADIGLIKLDVLGLKAMSTVDDTIALIRERHGIEIDPFDIDLEDKKVYDMLSEGYTRGVFQCEAAPYTSLIIKMGGVHSFAELTASNALVRPGAINTIGAEYIARKNGQKMTTFVHKDMEPFTRETYGEILYQEQVMLTMTELAGMSMGTANKVRKIIGKKKDVKEFKQFKEEFIEGASKKISRTQAEKLWTDFEAHAGYSFNKSHAVAYSMVSFWTAWLKCYYPLEFMAATLRNEKDKEQTTNYLIEVKRLGLTVKLPHVNASGPEITIEGDAIRLGLTSIKYISDAGSKKLIEHRPYGSYAELVARVEEKGSGLNKRMLGALNAIGAAYFEDNPKRGDERDNFYEYLGIPAFPAGEMDPHVRAKLNTLDEFEETGVFTLMVMVRNIKRGPGWARIECVDETGTAGIFAGEGVQVEEGRMYIMLVADNRVAKYATVEEITTLDNSLGKFLRQRELSIPEDRYRIISFKPHRTKAGKMMGYMVLQDHLGLMHHVLVFPQMFNKARVFAREGTIINPFIKETQDGTLFVEEFRQV